MPTKRAFAVVFIHGLAKKPSPEKLREIWLWGLARDNPMPSVFAPPNTGVDLNTMGIPQRFNYYADVFYGEDYEKDIQSYYEKNVEKEILAEKLDRVEPGLSLPQPVTPRERAFLRNFEAKLTASATPSQLITDVAAVSSLESDLEGGRSNYELAGFLPKPVREAIIKKAAMEAYYFLFNKEYIRSDGAHFMVRQELRKRLLQELAVAQTLADKTVIISHSMGTMVAYDVLRNCAECPPVDTLITLGSPLGIREVQDELIAIDAEDVDFPAAKLRNWINVYDPLDPICGADPHFANDYKPVDGKAVQDIEESNWSAWRHTITHYLAGNLLRENIRKAMEAQ